MGALLDPNSRGQKMLQLTEDNMKQMSKEQLEHEKAVDAIFTSLDEIAKVEEKADKDEGITSRRERAVQLLQNVQELASGSEVIKLLKAKQGQQKEAGAGLQDN
jgi:hypothetical protein